MAPLHFAVFLSLRFGHSHIFPTLPDLSVLCYKLSGSGHLPRKDHWRENTGEEVRHSTYIVRATADDRDL